MSIYEEILCDPPVPPEIIEAVNDDKLAVFIGAGVSRLVGCLGWEDLATRLVRECYRAPSREGTSILNYRQKESLLTDGDHRRTITICNRLLSENGLEDLFYETLKDAVEGRKEKLFHPNIYDDLYCLRGLFITTNIDKHFHHKFERQKIVYRVESLTPENIDRTNLYHI